MKLPIVTAGMVTATFVQVAAAGDINCAMLVKCSSQYLPVCGSDGKTYTNPCQFGAAVCNVPPDQPPLFQLFDGACEDQPNPFCGVRCTREYAPVCGSDGTTYPNACALVAAKCSSESLYEVHAGECPTRCDDVCPDQYEPVCGSDRRTYANACELQVAACKHPRRQLRQVATGPCRETLPPTLCSSPRCPKNYRPLCGSDGMTYANPCLFAHALCRDPTLRVASWGECKRQCFPPSCAFIYSPVCGSDGLTYPNDCLFGYEQCLHPGLTRVASGECPVVDPLGDADTAAICAATSCPALTECRVDPRSRQPYCADVCAPGRCDEGFTCDLQRVECFASPCPPVATCLPPN